jgi:hypothetical protein
MTTDFNKIVKQSVLMHENLTALKAMSSEAQVTLKSLKQSDS